MPLFSQAAAAASYWRFNAGGRGGGQHSHVNMLGFEPWHGCLFKRWCPVTLLNHPHADGHRASDRTAQVCSNKGIALDALSGDTQTQRLSSSSLWVRVSRLAGSSKSSRVYWLQIDSFHKSIFLLISPKNPVTLPSCNLPSTAHAAEVFKKNMSFFFFFFTSAKLRPFSHRSWQLSQKIICNLPQFFSP